MARLLAVDDDDAFLEVLVDHLKRRGHDVASCADPTQADALAASFKPQLAILDYAMPVLEGSQVLSQLHRRDPALPVIFLSAVSALNYAAQVPPDPRVRFLHKPVRLTDLDAQIASLLDPEGWSTRP